MKKIHIRHVLLSLLLLSIGNILAQEMVQDTASILLNQVSIIAPKNDINNRDLPAANYSLDTKKLEAYQVDAMKDLSLHVPNFYIPDYGSRITSSVYVRGVSSRMNEPSIGLYVDNIPYMDKSGFDFDFHDIRAISFLQGPQAMLYGRNAIGGLMNIYTLSPLHYQGSKASISVGRFYEHKIRFSHYGKLSSKLAYSLSGYHERDNGYFSNQFDGEKNQSESFGERVKLDWQMNDRWKSNLTFSYNHVEQNAYPYAELKPNGVDNYPINYNEDGAYERDAVLGGLSFQREGNELLFSSTSSYQYLNDEMKIDQDFTADSIFALSQKQNQHAFTQEFVLRSDHNKPYQWVSGIFGFYKMNEVDAPMLFRKGGVAMIQSFLDAEKANNPRMPQITITNDEMPIPGLFDLSTMGGAIYHQSSYRFWDRLTLTAGLRLEYEKTAIDYDTYATLFTDVNIMPQIPTIKNEKTPIIKGNMSEEYIQLLPKFSAKYDFNKRFNIYASIAKGYKAGGYNYSMLSDILQKELQASGSSNELNVAEEQIYYKPETLWNYELGTHSELLRRKLFADIAIFYIDNRNQQLSTSAGNGSRMITNAEKVRSYGIDASIRAYLLDNLSFTVAYGFTQAEFVNYKVEKKNDETNEPELIDYNGKTIPFVPQNTLSIGLAYDWHVNKELLDKITFAAQYTALGKIYWNEENTIDQEFYGLLNAEISFYKNAFQLDLWTKNALNTDYNVFYFESLEKSFVQKGKPLTFGATVSYSF